MPLDLQRGLRTLSAAPRLGSEPVPVDVVLTRVRRRRARRTVGASLAGVAVVVGLAVAVRTTPWSDEPIPPAVTTSPAPAPSSTPAPTPAAPTAGPDREPVATPPPLVALTSAGDLVLLDPTTGSQVRTVMTGLAPRDADHARVALSPDRQDAYVEVEVDAEPYAQVVRVSLADGSSEVVAQGSAPAVSPDGRVLATVGTRPGGSHDLDRGVNLLDLESGETTHVPDLECVACERVVTDVTWSADARELFVVVGWGDHPYDRRVVALRVGEGRAPVSIQAAPVVGPQAPGAVPPVCSTDDDVDDPWCSTWDEVAVLSDGRLVVSGAEGPMPVLDPGRAWYELDVWDDGAFLGVVDRTTGATTQRLPVPDMTVDSLQVAPGASGGVFVRTERSPDGVPRSTLYRWDLDGSVLPWVEDVVAAAW